MAQVAANSQLPKASVVPEDELAKALGPKLVAEIEEHSDSEDNEWEEWEEDEEDEDEEEEDDEEEDEDEEDEDEEEEEEEEEEESDSGPETEEEVYDPYEWHPSEEGFKESDLASRKKRRYLVGQHSFLLLADPDLKTALDPFNPEDEQITEGERRRRGIKAQKAAYKDKCKAAGIKPNAAYLAAIGTKLLDLTNNGLSEKEMVLIIESLTEDKTIETCLLSGNSIGNEGGLALAKMLENNVVIEVLKLANTEIVEAFFEICQAASNNMALSELDVSKNELEDDQMVFLGHMLAETASLTALYLSYNGITDKGLDNMTRGIRNNATLIMLDLSCNKIKGSQKSGFFFLACGNHPTLAHLSVRNNVVKTSPQVAKVLARNKRLQFMDLSFNIMDEDSGGPFGRSLHGKRQLTHLLFGKQHWHQKSASLALKPFTFPRNFNAETPMQLIDFGWLLDIHTAFIKMRDAAKKVNPELEIISGEPYGLNKVPEPDNESLVILRANTICENFETPLVMLMEELAKEPPEMTTTQFKKFIKQCNLYKDKVQTEAFEKVFEKGPMVVNAAAIIAAFDKVYPGLRKIPDPELEGEVEEKPKKEKKKKKGKGKKGKKGGKGKGKAKSPGGGAKAPKKGKGKGKKK